MTQPSDTAAPTPGPYAISTRPTGRRVFMPDDVIEIRAPRRNDGLIACLYASNWPNQEDRANANLLAASWATAAERDRLVGVNAELVEVLSGWLPIAQRQLDGLLRTAEAQDGAKSLFESTAWKTATERVERMRTALANARTPPTCAKASAGQPVGQSPEGVGG